MNKFTGLEMLQIDLANCYGLDKETWTDRLCWFGIHVDNLYNLVNDAADPMLFMKAIKSYEHTIHKIPTGHCMFLDATASGLQVMAALSGCKKTAAHVNMVNTGKREDVYTEISNKMNILLHPIEHTDRNLIKKPAMTHYYNKYRQDTLTDDQQEAFYKVLAESFEGAEAVKQVINDYWDNSALEHTWTLPDGHVSQVKVTEMVNTRIEVDELDHVTYTYRFEANLPSNVKTSLVPNIIHSVDGYIAREMVRRANKEGFELAHIHDAFCAHPNNMQRVRELYTEIMADIADMDLLQDILSEISGKDVQLTKFSNDLSKDILESEYMLS